MVGTRTDGPSASPQRIHHPHPCAERHTSPFRLSPTSHHRLPDARCTSLSVPSRLIARPTPHDVCAGPATNMEFMDKIKYIMGCLCITQPLPGPAVQEAEKMLGIKAQS